MPKTVELDLSLIVRDAELQPRESLDQDTIVQYAEDMAAGIAFPYVVVYHDGKRYWLSQGFHRCEAADAAGWTSIETEVREGTRDDARWDAAGSNKEFDAAGQRRSNADKQRAVRMALEAKPDWSDRRIAQHVGTANSYVSKMRQVFSENTSNRRTGSDGKSYPASTINRIDPDRRFGKAFEAQERETSVAVLPRPAPLPGQKSMFNGEDEDDRPDPLPIVEPIKPVPNPTFNQTNEMVDWARWTWNPVTGCKHDCVYCYARDIANRFYAEKFEPTYRPDRLSAPRNTRLPGLVAGLTDPVERTAWKNVFVCSMADLFGRWVPDEWIDGVFGACRESPQWNYLFLTKFPNRYVDLDIPDNSWVGTSVDEQKRVANAEKSFASIKAAVKWLSVEPMREAIHFKDLSVFDWIVIGGQSRSSGAPEFFPDPHWVVDLIAEAHRAGCKVYCKPNTDPEQHFSKLFREYPEAFGVRAAGMEAAS